MIILLVFAIVAFVVFSNRAAQIGEWRKAFWGLSGVAAVIGPSIVAGVIVGILESILEVEPERANYLRGFVGVICLIAGVLLAKWMLDRFLPLPEDKALARDTEASEDD